MNYAMIDSCNNCKHAKQKAGKSYYCVKYGIIIGYPKRTCRGYEREQVREQKDRMERR